MSDDNEPASHNSIIVIPSAARYAEQMEDLLHVCYGTTRDEPEQVFTAAMFRQHLDVFPAGQFIAVDTATDTVVGVTVSMRVNFNPQQRMTEGWWASIGYGWLTTHIANGEWMYGVESCVHPAYRGQGVGSKLMDARFDVLRRLNLRGMIAGSAIIDYYKVADTVPVDQYVADVVAGRRYDTNLTKQLHKGFKAHYPISNYVTDEESLRYGVLIVWENAEYRPEPRIAARAAQPVPVWHTWK